jgi:hypothetical protein
MEGFNVPEFVNSTLERVNSAINGLEVKFELAKTDIQYINQFKILIKNGVFENL